MSDGYEREDGEEWTEDGFTFRQVFGLPKLISAPDDYQPIVEDEGTQIEWETEPIFQGTFRGIKIIPNVPQLSGGTKDVTLLRFIDKDGLKRSAWGNYQLEDFAHKTPEGSKVVIEYVGKKEFGKSGQSMQAFNMYAKPPQGESIRNTSSPQTTKSDDAVNA